MSSRQASVISALLEGQGLVFVQSDNAQDYLTSLKKDPCSDTARPVIAWDSVEAFTPPDDYTDALPDIMDMVAAFEFVRSYPGSAIFVFDCRDIDWTEHETRLRKLARQLHMKLANQNQVHCVVVTRQPLTTSLAERVTWIGDAPASEASAAATTATTSNVADEFRDIRNIVKFDTPEWQQRLDHMTADQAERLVHSGAYRESLERLNELRGTLKSRFARKDEIIDAICAAAIAQVPTVLIGPPGTAKSNMIRCFCEGLGLTAQHTNGDAHGDGTPKKRGYFEYLLTRYTTPEEIFGPVHVQDLIDKQRYRRVTDGYLPEAQIAFLDELFKASSAILNTLLTLLNERIFYNGGVAMPIPLMMVFAASNEAPTDEGLQALYDRFPLRLNCPPVADDHVGDLLTASWQQAYDRQFGSQQVAVKPCACANDLRLLRHVMRVRYGGRTVGERGGTGVDFGEEFLRYFRSLRSDFSISDRTAALLLAFCRAQALMNERSELSGDELNVFRYVVWDEGGTGELDRLVTNLGRGMQ